MTLSSGLVLPGKLCKVDRVALSDSRGDSHRSYTGHQILQFLPRNPTWEPNTQLRGCGLRRPSSL